MRAAGICAARLNTTTTGGSSFSVGQYYTIGQSWRTVRSSVMTGGAGGTNVYVRIDIAQGALAAELYVDCVQVNATPICPWQLGSTAQAADSLIQTLRTESSWSEVFAVQTLAYEETYEAAAALTIRTWSLDADNKIVLTFDPADNKFKITRTIDGTPEAAVLSAAQYWHGEQAIRFVLAVSAAAVHLTIDNAGQIETLDDGGLAALVDADITAAWGDCPLWVLQLAAAHLAIFRSEDPENFDWADPDSLVLLQPYPVTGDLSIPSQALTADTTYYYLARAVSAYGQLSEPVLTDACAVVVQDDGTVEPPVGNEPADLTVTPVAGGVLEVRWRYSEAGQPAVPTGFKIYSVSDDPEPLWTLLATVPYRNRPAAWRSEALAHETELAVCVRTYKTYTFGTGEEAYDVDYETANTATVTATADAVGPPAITGLAVELIE
jgi:hypothetical protein